MNTEARISAWGISRLSRFCRSVLAKTPQREAIELLKGSPILYPEGDPRGQGLPPKEALKVVIEMLAAIPSVVWGFIGYMIISAQRMLRTASIIFGIFTIGVLGLVTDYAFKWMYRRLFPWVE